MCKNCLTAQCSHALYLNPIEKLSQEFLLRTTRANFPNAKEEFLRLHPHLKDRFEQALKSSD